MKVKFTTCLGTTKGKIWKFEEKFFNNVPECSGVYIIGIKSKSNTDKNEMFYPMYVGEATNLRSRIVSHYLGNSPGTLNGNKEIFDLSDRKLDSLYNSIHELNSKRSNFNHSNGKMKSLSFPSGCRKCKKDRELFNGGLSKENTLLWFPNPDFFNFKVGNGWQSILPYHDRDYMHSQSLVRDLSRSYQSGVLSQAILLSKHILWEKFFFIYAEVSKKDADIAEYYTKRIMDENKLYTLAIPKLKKDPKVDFTNNLTDVSISVSFKIKIN